ncbi:MAG TPA: response regulator [Desulfopila sp.]|nr:response regulator [Desulfopila sp.]
MPKKGILFVDDEPNILSGIKRMLRSMRQEYDFHFAGDGRTALDLIESENIDVVISDMRMPGMDGAEFLERVREHHPEIIRIMLTGQADEESVYRTVNIVHQFLSKPCDPDKLKNLIVRSSALRDLLTDVHLKRMVSGIDNLPSLPEMYTQLQQVLQREDASAEEVAAIIEQDVAMTAKLLQLVNSSFFGLYQKVESPARAVKLLGFDTIKILVLGVQIFSGVKVGADLISLDYLKEHSMMVAQCSKKIALASSDDTDVINNCFLAGMLHDIGRLLLLSHMTDSYLPVVERAQEEETNLTDNERDHFNASHGEIGAYLVGLWGFASEILEAIAYHNNMDASMARAFSPALAVHVADYFYYKNYPEKAIGKVPALAEEHIDKLGLSDRIESWSELCAEVLEKNDE